MLLYFFLFVFSSNKDTATKDYNHIISLIVSLIYVCMGACAKYLPFDSRNPLSILAPNLYFSSHKVNFIEYYFNSHNYYKYVLKPVLEDDNVRFYWDHSIITDRAVLHNRSDKILMDWAQ